MLVIFAGLPGTGKSTVARALAARTGGVVLDKDPIRATLFPPQDVEYTAEQDDFCLQVMLDTAGYLLRKNPARVVILDGRTFSRRYQIEAAVRWAEQFGTPWKIVECVCSEETARKRLEEDLRLGTHPAKNRDWVLYQTVKAHFEPITLPKVLVNTDLTGGNEAAEFIGLAAG